MLFIQNQYQYFVVELKYPRNYTVIEFSNGEYAIELEHQVAGQDCVVVGSLTGPAKEALVLLLLIATLKKFGALQVVLVAPYLGYQRQDHEVELQSLGMQFADKLLHTGGVDRIITLEPHNITALQNLQVPIDYFSSEIIFYDEIDRFVTQGFGFVFPDFGAALRYDWLLEKFPDTIHGYFIKNRIEDFVQIIDFHGKVGDKVIIYDDILDSGATLIQTCIALQSMGVGKIVIFVTHAFFHGDVWRKLFNLGVVMLYCTNSLPEAHRMDHTQIKVLPATILLQNFI